MKAAIIVILSVSALAVLISLVKSKHFFVALMLTAIQGLSALFAVDYIGGFIGVNVNINPFTLALSSLGGIPGVSFLLLISIILK